MSRRSVWVALVIFCFSLNLCTYTASGQAVFGSVIGTVTDAQGNAVAGAKVTVTSLSKSTVFETTSNESGNYAVTHLIPDSYKVEVEAPGFKVYSVASVTVQADSSVTLDASLQVGAVTQTVEVTGAPPLVDTISVAPEDCGGKSLERSRSCSRKASEQMSLPV